MTRRHSQIWQGYRDEPPSAVRLRARPTNDILGRGRTILVSNRNDGFIHAPSDQGLFVHDTRLLDTYRYLANGEPLRAVTLSAVNLHTWLGYYVIPVHPAADPAAQFGIVPQQVVEVRLSRNIGGGFHEDVDVTNYAQRRARVRLVLELASDFRDSLEVERKGAPEGTCSVDFIQLDGGGEYRARYVAENTFDHQGDRGTRHLDRSLVLRIARADSPPHYHDGKIEFDFELDPHRSWHACVLAGARIEATELSPVAECRRLSHGGNDEREVRRATFWHYGSTLTGACLPDLTETVVTAFRQAKADLAALRLDDLDVSERTWTVAAGLPRYQALFGRDMLTAGWQSSLLSTEMLKGGLEVLEPHQGKKEDLWHAEQPGRMIHQVRTGPFAQLEINPFRRHYATLTASSFFPVALSEYWHWTGDGATVTKLLDAALKSMQWLDHYAKNEEGFYEYRELSEQPQKNQSWKDSGEAIVHADGTQACDPIATCDAQGYVYAAKMRLAELAWWFGSKDDARSFHRSAEELKARFNDRFWMEDEGYYALALDGDRRLARSISSNPGHCMASALIDASRVERVVERMLAPELATGFGIRTLSRDHPAYNPYAYQRGSVWPVEQASFALGCFRWGLRQHGAEICRQQFEAAKLFDYHRLPECYGGQPRDQDHPFPALYTRANWPQAWSSSAVILMVQSLLGLYPFAPLHLLLVDPALPEWLPDVTLHGIRVGQAIASIRFTRDRKGRTEFEVLEKRGPLHVIRQPSPWSLTTSLPERIRDVLTSLAA